jgi:hypothetical protein
VTGVEVGALRDRISQVAVSTLMQPPLDVHVTAIPNPTDEALCVLIVQVAASENAPHMVDQRYWGRSSHGKRALADVEVSRLLAERRHHRDDFQNRLLAMVGDDFDPITVGRREHGHFYLSLEPTAAHVGEDLTRALGTATPDRIVRDAQSFQPFVAQWLNLTNQIPHPDGIAGCSVELRDPDALAEKYLLYMVLADNGSIRVVSGSGTEDARARPSCRPFSAASHS